MQKLENVLTEFPQVLQKQKIINRLLDGFEPNTIIQTLKDMEIDKANRSEL